MPGKTVITAPASAEITRYVTRNQGNNHRGLLRNPPPGVITGSTVVPAAQLRERRMTRPILVLGVQTTPLSLLFGTAAVVLLWLLWPVLLGVAGVVVGGRG